SHELARHATYNLLPVARRRALHRAAVQALRERGGRDALTRAAVRYHRGRAESVALQAGRWAKRHAVGVAFGSVGALIAAAVFIQHTRRTPALDPDLVAVAPFDVLDRKFALWHEGLVDYLSRNLDGAGSIRTVSPTIVLRGWNGPADPASATELGRRSGARWVVFGQMVGEGSDSVRLRPTVIDVASGRALAEPERSDLGDRIDRLADSLTRDVLRDLGRLGPAVRVGAPLGTRSLPALKEFLNGEQLLRRFSLDSAITAYGVAVQQTIEAFNRAMALDPAFAPAYFHPVQLALDRNDTAAAQRYVDGYLRLTSGVPEGAGLRLVARLLSGEPSRTVQSLLDTAPA